MARGGWLIAIGLLLAATGTAHASSCDVERPMTGVLVAVKSGIVSVAEVDAGSVAERGGLRAGDVVVQVNDVLPRSCSQWADAVEDARDDRKAVLLLVRRGETEVPLALPSSVWGVPETPPAVAADEDEDAPAEPAAKRFVEAPKPPPLPPEEPVSVEAVTTQLAALAPTPDEPPTNLVAYREQVLRIRREIETLAARQSAPPPTIDALRNVARYFEAAEVAWEALEGDRDMDRRSRRMPVAENATVPYFSDSPQAAVIDEFDFLSATVSSEPTRATRFAESSGRWRPMWARILLWERGNKELQQLRQAQ
jgi:hypothetical protein